MKRRSEGSKQRLTKWTARCPKCARLCCPEDISRCPFVTLHAPYADAQSGGLCHCMPVRRVTAYYWCISTGCLTTSSCLRVPWHRSSAQQKPPGNPVIRDFFP